MIPLILTDIFIITVMLHRFEPSVSHLRSFKRGVRYKPYSAYFTFDAYHITVIIESVSLAESFFAQFINLYFFVLP